MIPPVFTDPVLDDVAKATADAFSDRARDLDNVGADIRALDAYLWATGVRVETKPISIDDIDSEAISWAKAEPDGRFRVTWRRRGGGNLDRRPLIEAPSDARLRAKPFLPALLKAVAAAVKP